MSQPTSQKPYYRDSFTWLAYFMLAYYGYVQAVPGPAMPLLRDELGLSHGIAGLHFSVFAIGMIFAGITSTALIRYFGRRLMFWGGGAGMALGAILMIFGSTAPMTIGGMFVMGWVGTYVLNLVPATLSDHHGDNRATAVTEANVAASATIALAPLFVGFFATTALGWRTGVLDTHRHMACDTRTDL